MPVDFSKEKHVPKHDGDTGLSVKPDTGGALYVLDVDNIRDKLAAVQNNPTLFGALVSSLKTKFRTNREIHVIDTLIREMAAKGRGVEGQIELVNIHRELNLAVAKLQNIHKDIEVENLKKDVEAAELKVRIARAQKEIDDIWNPKSPDSEEEKEEPLSKWAKQLEDEEERMYFKRQYEKLKVLNKLKRIQGLEDLKQEIIEKRIIKYCVKHKVRNPGELTPAVMKRLKNEIEELDDMFDALMSQVRREASV